MNFESSSKTLFLRHADVLALELDPESVRLAIRDAFVEYGNRVLMSEPKTSIVVAPGHAFQSLCAVDIQSGYAAIKWVGMVPPGGKAPININATILLSDVPTGQLKCIMDANHVTGLRTAGMSAEAARLLARQGATSIGFVGAGTQANSHLAALKAALPGLRVARIASRTEESAAKLAESCTAAGLIAEVATSEAVLRESDVVVSTVPFSAGFQPFLDARWLKSGALAIAVDLGRSWIHHGLDAADLTVVDDEPLKKYAKPGNMVPSLGYAQATLADLACGRHAGRTDDQQRIMYFSSGSAVGDLAIAKLAYERAVSSGRGTTLEN